MKKLLLSFGILSILLVGCTKETGTDVTSVNSETNLKSCKLYKWKKFTPDFGYFPTSGVKYNSPVKMTFLAMDSTSTGQITYVMSGGIKYRISLGSIKSRNAAGGLFLPATFTYLTPGTAAEIAQVDSVCSFIGSGNNGYLELKNLVFEKYTH
jgi:hypothetical protein